jgi:hypothetical protein
MRRSFFVRAIFTPTLEIMAAVGIALTVVFAARAVAAGNLQPDRVISFLATIVLLYTPLKSLGGTGQGVTQGLAGARRLWEVLDEPVEPVPGLVELPPFAQEIRFERVSFRYRDEGPWVLRHLDLTLRRGEVIALVGPSGGQDHALEPPHVSPIRTGRPVTRRAQIAPPRSGAPVADRPGGPGDVPSRHRAREHRVRVAGAARAAGGSGEGCARATSIRGAPPRLPRRWQRRTPLADTAPRDRPGAASDAPSSAARRATSADTERARGAEGARSLMEQRTCRVSPTGSRPSAMPRIAVLIQGRVVELDPRGAAVKMGEYARLYERSLPGSLADPQQKYKPLMARARRKKGRFLARGWR